MSRILYLLRHGQASPADDYGLRSDKARELSAVGRRELQTLAQQLSQRAEFAPSQVLVSSATRTQQTAAMLPLANIQLRDDYYNADPQALLKGLAELDASTSQALIVAHNPGISWLAASLLRPQPSAGFSPASLLALSLDCAWAEIKAGDGRLLWRLDPPQFTANLSQQG